MGGADGSASSFEGHHRCQLLFVRVTADSRSPSLDSKVLVLHGLECLSIPNVVCPRCGCVDFLDLELGSICQPGEPTLLRATADGVVASSALHPNMIRAVSECLDTRSVSASGHVPRPWGQNRVVLSDTEFPLRSRPN